MSVVKDMANNIAVMYLGKIVEYNKTEALFSNPKHPYTKALFGAIPRKEMND
jgi:ABC-type oligopeptide transport system ATPase subunit